MQSRNFVAEEIAEICQPFNPALFHNFLLPLLITFAFLKLRVSKMSSSAKARTVPRPFVAAASFSAHCVPFY